MFRRAVRSGGDIAVLEACADGAGRALVCTYSSSAEFDAAIIHARRAAGVYGPRRHRRTFSAVAGVFVGLIVVALVLL